jgi:hypothetical protein
MTRRSKRPVYDPNAKFERPPAVNWACHVEKLNELEKITWECNLEYRLWKETGNLDYIWFVSVNQPEGLIFGTVQTQMFCSYPRDDVGTALDDALAFMKTVQKPA